MQYKYFPELKQPEKMSPEFMEKLIELREYVDFPLPVNSGYRSPEDNASADGHKKSMHMQGRAVDIKVNGYNAGELFLAAVYVGFRGIGSRQHGDRKRRFMHLDDRDGPLIIWTYNDR